MKDQFELVSPYQPSGDQPEAIKELVDGLNLGRRAQTLLGATGTGKTFTVANVIQASKQADASHCTQQNVGWAIVRRVEGIFSRTTPSNIL